MDDETSHAEAALRKRESQGWVKEVAVTLDDCIARVKRAKQNNESTSIAYLGNIVDLWERLAEEQEMLVDLGSDQTSLHNPFNGGYYPVGLTFEQSNKMMTENPEQFRKQVQQSLVRHVAAINKLTKRGMRFWDYGNSL